MVIKAEKNNLEEIANLAAMLWTNHTVQDLKDKLSEVISKDNAQFFIKYEHNSPVGFAQCQLRHDYVEGADTSPVGYLEGIFVKEEYRRRGYARELFRECENWAKSRGCREFAADCEIDNFDSQNFHKSMNFSEVNRIICFLKKL